jgi:GT2 family glycosyltransferase
VIIPVYGHSEQLSRCLEALGKQTWPAARHEIVVVDNAPVRTLALAGSTAGGSVVRCIHEPAPGSYAARNAGAAAARGEILAFTDADCVPTAYWIERGVEVLRRSAAGIVAGRVALFVRDPAAPTTVDLFESLVAFEQRMYVESRGFGATANLFVRAAALRSVGGFDARLRSRGDEEFCRRVRAIGHGVAYCDDAVVAHPARHSLAALVHRTRRLAGGGVGLDRLRHPTRGARALASLSALALEFVPPAHFAARVFADASVHGIGRKARVILLLMLLRWVSAFERIRVASGGEPLR